MTERRRIECDACVGVGCEACDNEGWVWGHVLREVPRGPFNTPEAVNRAREYLGLNMAGMARALRLGENGDRTIGRIESGGNSSGVPGPMQVALEALVAGFRPRGLKLPGDKP